MTINGTRFGEINFQQEDLFVFQEGLIGFPMLQNFVFVEHTPQSPFKWLQSLEEPSLAFLVTDPAQFVRDYSLPLNNAELALTTVAIPTGRPFDMTLNLAGPIVINEATRQGRQVVLDDGSYTVKHRVFAEADAQGEQAAA